MMVMYLAIMWLCGISYNNVGLDGIGWIKWCQIQLVHFQHVRSLSFGLLYNLEQSRGRYLLL